MSVYRLYPGNCLEVLRTFEADSVDAIVTDPPYELGFMGRKWDSTGIAYSVEMWAECLRVLKPGGHLLAFGGARTYHRMASAVENAGFEIRDSMQWLYSVDPLFRQFVDSLSPWQLAMFERLMDALGMPAMLLWVYGSGFPKSKNLDGEWAGWGTALKPAHEPVAVARKPLVGTVAQNVATYGTGAFYIDGCRVPLQGEADAAEFANNHAVTERLPADYADRKLGLHDGGWKQKVGAAEVPTGRWPANLLHDGSAGVLEGFPAKAGAKAPVTGEEPTANGFSGAVKYSGMMGRVAGAFHGDAGSAARFFYSAKASRRDRDEGLEGDNQAAGRRNKHPTVKPTELMRYLCRLVTPPGGIVLDPFMGSGSTGKAAVLEGFRFIGIEQDPESVDVAQGRIEHALRTLAQGEAPARGDNLELPL